MKQILITGTSRGIGFELVRVFSGLGHRVISLSRNIQPIKDLDLPGVLSIPCDLTNNDDLEKLEKYFTDNDISIDVLVNNAGAIVNKPFMEITSRDFLSVYSTNVFAVARLTRLVLPFMTGGHVVNISSMGGVQGSAKFPGLTAYSSSKGALITLTEVLAEEFKETGPAFNVLALGAVQTEMLEEAFPGYVAPVQPEDMAKYIANFSLNGNKFYNGKVLQVSSSTP